MKQKNGKKKTEHRFRGITIPTGSHPIIRQIKRNGDAPSIHGDKLWKSSRLVIDYLHKNRPEHNKNVIDVGCGWGATGIWCAKTLGSKVTSMDADASVFPFLEATATLNGVETEHLVSRFEKLTKKQLGKQDILVGADICFWDELIKPVSKMVKRAVKSGVKTIVIADPGREPFFEMAQHCEKKYYAEMIDWETKSPLKADGYLLVIENA